MDMMTTVASGTALLQRPRQRFVIQVLLLFFFSMIPGHLQAATYYVDASNPGAGDGTINNPWRNLSSVTGYSAGDTILFRRGEVWHESLVVRSSGSVSLPITFGAYGSGDRPLFDGTFAGSVTWQQVQPNIYKITNPSLSTNPGLLIYKGTAKPEITTLRFSAQVPGALQKGAILLQTDGVYTNLWVTAKSTNTVSGITFFTINTTKNVYVRQLNASGIEESWSSPLGVPTIITSPDGLTEPGHWYWDDQGKSVYLYSDTDPNSLDVQIGQLLTGIYTNGKSFLNIQDIAVQGYRGEGVLITGSQDVVVENMHVSNIGAGRHQTGILINNSKNNLIKNNRVESVLRVGIGIYAVNNTTFYSHGNTVTGNTVINSGSTGISLNTDGQKVAYVVENNMISGNSIFNANALSYDSAGIYSIFVGGGNFIRANTIKDGGSSALRSAGIMIEGGNDPAIKPLVIENNSIENNSLAGIAVSGEAHKITGNTVRYNGVPSWESAQLVFFATFGKNASSCTVQNNVMEARAGQVLVSVLNAMGPGSPPHTINNNTYCSVNSTPFCWSGWTCSTPLDFIAWKNVSGHDVNSSFTSGTCSSAPPSPSPSPSPSGKTITGMYLLLLD